MMMEFVIFFMEVYSNGAMGLYHLSHLCIHAKKTVAMVVMPLAAVWRLMPLSAPAQESVLTGGMPQMGCVNASVQATKCTRPAAPL